MNPNILKDFFFFFLKDLYGKPGNRFKMINARSDFNKKRFTMFYWCGLAPCVGIFRSAATKAIFFTTEFPLSNLRFFLLLQRAWVACEMI